MKSFLQSLGVGLFGLATSVLVAIADVALAHWLGFDLFSFSFWVIVPVGAIILGMFAASGYYFGATYFQKRANRVLLVQIVVIAGLAQCLIYYLGYVSITLDDGRKLAALVPFSEYMDVMLTKAHYRTGRGQVDTGEVGSMGYWLAGLQFVGFLLGGLAMYLVLKVKSACAPCDLYLQRIGSKYKVFPDSASAEQYYEQVFMLPTDSAEFSSMMRAEPTVDNVEPGAMKIHTVLRGCPHCKVQSVEDSVHGYNGKEWKLIGELERRVDMPAGVDLAPLFRA